VISVARVLGDEIRTPIASFYNSALGPLFHHCGPERGVAIDNGQPAPAGWRHARRWKSGGPSARVPVYGSTK
jgi:hypothetical protein